MSEIETDLPQEDDGEVRIDSSMASWMQERRKAREETKSETFPVPTFRSKLKVELGYVGLKRLTGLREHHLKKTQGAYLQSLYINADTVLLATRGFYWHFPDRGWVRVAAVDATWRTMARFQNPDLGDALTDRQALLSMLDEVPLAQLAADYTNWMTSRGEEDDEEAYEDLEAAR